ncbi:MAG TPA: GMC family oxidoreductase [Solirubrobacteraceae bacterium]|nr:GMC family oxidoreductase [Solirubrobacteraceae bacterium]
MFADARRVPERTEIQTDVCVVGAGAAGITLAKHFSGRRTRVVLLESGGFELDAETQQLCDGPNAGLPYFALLASRLRYFGGTTGHWGGTCRPMEPEDFGARPGVPRSGWPIGRADLDPYYGAAAELVGIRDMEWDLASWARRSRFEPFDLGDRVQTRVGRLVRAKNRRWGELYREDVRRAPDVTSYLYANVTELETDETGRRVTRARAATLGGNRFTVRARWFVLAAGGIENARLLLLSDRRHPRGLGNDHDMVGRCFLEHPRFRGAVVVPARSSIESRFYTTHGAAGADIEGYLAVAERRQVQERLVDVQIGIRPVFEGGFQDVKNAPDVVALKALGGEPSSGDLAEDVRKVAGDLGTWHAFTIPGAPLPVPYPEVAGKLLGSPDDRKALVPRVLGDIAAFAYTKLVGSAPVQRLDVITRIASAPEPDSRVTLAGDRDALGLRRAKLTWKLSPIDRRSVVRSLELLGAAVGAAGLGRLRLLVGEDDRSWPDDLQGAYHHMGTTRMSADPRDGVVDRNCRVHGVANLYVAGSSVFPTPGAGTPTMTLVALALRLGHHLDREIA